MHGIAAHFRLWLLLALAGLCGSNAALARESRQHEAPPWVTLAELPVEARQTLRLIKQGGPFPYPHKDGSTFGNYEKRLPINARRYYKEYTVPTPGRRDRRPRRIVAGGKPASEPTEFYYTGDHYRSFQRIREP